MEISIENHQFYPPPCILNPLEEFGIGTGVR